MIGDSRYGAVHVLIESGHIKSFREIFNFIPKTTVYLDLGVNFSRFCRAIINPSLFRLEELMELAEMFDVDARILINMAYEQCLSAKKHSIRNERKPIN